MTKTIQEKINDNDYSTKLPYVRKSVDTEAYWAWSLDNSALKQVFRSDLEEEFGIVGNPKATKLWEIANGRDNNYGELYDFYLDVAELIL